MTALSDEAEEEEKKQNDDEKKEEVACYVVDCKARRRKNATLFEVITTDTLLSGITTEKIYGYGVDLDLNTKFKPVNYALRGIKNHFISALHASFMEHLPFQLSVDTIWILLAQQIATHITLNAEKLRETFVDFDGKKEIVVIDDALDMNNSDENDWSNVLNQFEAGCKKLSNDKVVDMITSNFSTTTETTKAASQCVLFKALSEYISFRTLTRSGIPSIRLIGSLDDWKKVQTKCLAVKEMKIGLDFWLQHLQPIVDNIVETVAVLSEISELSDELIMFWESIYSFQSMSGGQSCSGWAKSLFPYLAQSEKNQELDWQKGRSGWSHVSPGDFPATYCMCPMIWEYCGKEYQTGMFGGVIGIAQQQESGCMAPIIGWMIAQRK